MRKFRKAGYKPDTAPRNRPPNRDRTSSPPIALAVGGYGNDLGLPGSSVAAAPAPVELATTMRDLQQQAGGGSAPISNPDEWRKEKKSADGWQDPTAVRSCPWLHVCNTLAVTRTDEAP